MGFMSVKCFTFACLSCLFRTLVENVHVCVLSRYASDASYHMGEYNDHSTTDTNTLLLGQESQRHVFVWRSR